MNDDLSMLDLDQVIGGATDNPVPGGSVYHDKNGTLMTFGKTTIFVGNDGGLVTSTGGKPTITPAP